MPSTIDVRRSAFAFTVIVAALLGGSQAAEAAAVRVTPPFSIPVGGTVLCTAVSLSGAAHTVTIEVRDFAGNLVPFTNANCSAANPKSTSVDPGEVSAIGCSGSGYRYCKFTIKGAGKSAIRGVLRASDGSGATLAVLPAE